MNSKTKYLSTILAHLAFVCFLFFYALAVLIISDNSVYALVFAIIAFSLCYTASNLGASYGYHRTLPKWWGRSLWIVGLLVFVGIQLLNIVGVRALKSTIEECKRKGYVVNHKTYLLNAHSGISKWDVNLTKNLLQTVDAKWQKATEKDEYQDLPALDPEDLKLFCEEEYYKKTKGLLKEMSNIMPMLKEVASLPKIAIPLDIPEDENFWTVDLPHLVHARDLVKFLALYAAVQEKEGDRKEMMDSLEMMFRFSKIWDEESFLIHQLCARSLRKSFVRYIVYFLPRMNLNELSRTKKWLEYQLEYLPIRPHGELVFLLSLMEMKQEHNPSFGKIFDLVDFEVLFISKGWLNWNIAKGVEGTLDAYENYNTEDKARSFIAATTKRYSFFFFIAELIIPNYHSIVTKELERLAWSRTAYLTCRLQILEKQKQETERIQDISMRRDLVDPFSGKPLSVEETEKSWKVYSLGLRDSNEIYKHIKPWRRSRQREKVFGFTLTKESSN